MHLPHLLMHKVTLFDYWERACKARYDFCCCPEYIPLMSVLIILRIVSVEGNFKEGSHL